MTTYRDVSLRLGTVYRTEPPQPPDWVCINWNDSENLRPWYITGGEKVQLPRPSPFEDASGHPGEVYARYAELVVRWPQMWLIYNLGASDDLGVVNLITGSHTTISAGVGNASRPYFRVSDQKLYWLEGSGGLHVYTWDPADQATPPSLVQSTATSGGDPFRYVWYRDHVCGPHGTSVKLMHLDTGETETRAVSGYVTQYGMLRGVSDPGEDRWGRGAMGSPGAPSPALRVVVNGSTTAAGSGGAADLAIDYTYQSYAMARPSLGGAGMFFFPYRLSGGDRVGKWFDLAEDSSHPHNSSDVPIGGFGYYDDDTSYPPQMVFPVGATPTY